MVSTAILHRYGLIVELNPLMRPIIERGEWLFVGAKGATLVVAWVVMAWYCRHNREFVNRACLVGGAAYLAIWAGWFLAAQA